MRLTQSTKSVRIMAACLLATLWAGSHDALATVPEVPRYENTNVILISLQCLRPDHLGTYGYARKTSENIDALGKESIVFDNAISQANLTPVAQMSVLTSQYPRVNGMVSFEVNPGQVSENTLPSILKYYGYTTAATISSPEFFMRYDTGTGTVVNPGDVFSKSFDYYGRTRRGLGGRSIRKVPAEALQWLTENKDKKFFLWIASGLIHMPYAAAVPEPLRKMYDPAKYTPFWKHLPLPKSESAGSDDPSYEVFSRVFRNNFYLGFAPVYHLSADDINYVNARYDAGVYYTDRFVGEVMKLVDSLKLTQKTLVVLQSIHGEDLGEQGNFFHYDVTDTVIKNALMMRFPEGEFAGKRMKEQVQGIDIMPTVLNYLDIPAPHEAQGKSLLPFLKGEEKTAPNEFAYIDRLPWWEYTLSQWYLDFKNAQGDYFIASEKEKLTAYQKLLKERFDKLDAPPGDIAIRTNEWKLVLRKNKELLDEVSWWNFISGKKHQIDTIELYDLGKDPLEKVNVATAHPDIVSKLQGKLITWDTSVEQQKTIFKKESKHLIIPYP
ncbi:MAG: sulfatase [Desulfobulbaceae bacterium]|nr:sulfatase [Desulfobulbaceae bacterium]